LSNAQQVANMPVKSFITGDGARKRKLT